MNAASELATEIAVEHWGSFAVVAGLAAALVLILTGFVGRAALWFEERNE